VGVGGRFREKAHVKEVQKRLLTTRARDDP